ncbi:MAG: Ig-like domain-containing protein [Eubacterium sp.]|nr:Ig-like domain-containing protein [Eubacterium sp.]
MENKGKTFRHKVLAWMLVIAMAVSMAPVTASAALVPHTHNGRSFSPGVGQGVLHTCNCYLVHDEKVNNTTGIIVSGSAVTVNICLNGHTLDLGGNNIRVVNGATLNIYDCAGGGGKITGGKGATYKDKRGGAIYVQGSTLNIYGGTIEGNEAVWGGAIFIDGTELSGISTVNMYGGTICGNTAEKGGGGIEVENGTGPTYGSYFNMYGGSIINNKVTNTNGSVHKGGGVHYAAGEMSIQGKVNITGNTVAGEMDNLYLRSDMTLTVGTVAEGSRIGVSAYDVENSGSDTQVTKGYGSNISSNSIKYFYMDSLHNSENYALVLDGRELAIVKQTHVWKYEKGTSANQIRAYCDNSNHTCAFKKTGSNTPTLTLNAKDMVYSGKQYNGISYGEEEETKWTYAGLTMPTVMYAGTGDTVYDSFATPPTNAGTYTASITVGTGENIKTATKQFTIAPKSIAGAVITFTDGDKRKYTGNQITQTIKNVSASGITTYLQAEDYEQDVTSVMVATDAAVYTVKINGQGNFTGSATAEWKITHSELMSGLITTQPAVTYDGNCHSPAVAATTPSTASALYSTSVGGPYTATPPAFTAVGTHTVYYRLECEGYEPETGTLTVTINPGAVYNITMGSVDNGRITASVNGEIVDKAGYGSEVTLTATPDRGYQFSRWIVSNGAIEVSDIHNNKFTMPNTDVEMRAEFVEAPGSSTGGSDTSATPVPPTENYTIPVKNENTVQVDAEITGGMANVSEITTETIDKVVNNADKESKVDTITIDLSGAKQEVTGVTLSKTTVETLAKATAEKDNGIETATIELSKATVVLDNKTLETLVEQAKGSQIELVVADTEQKKLNTAQQTTLNEYQVATTFEAYFTSDGERIHDFNGGKAVASIKFEPEAGKDASYYHLVYVADDGKLTRYKTKYQGGKLMFTTTHFSDYAVIYDTSEKNETEDGSDGTDITLDTSYRKLRLRVPTSTKTTNVLKWTKVAGADGYVIYGAPCNTKAKTYQITKLATIKNGNTTTWTDKNLTSGTYYKYYIKAYKLVNGKKVWLAKSKVVHSTTTGGKYGNAKSVKVNKTSVSLAVGKTFTIKAEQVLKDKPIAGHQNIKYESSNSKVASVTSKGVIKAKKKGPVTFTFMHRTVCTRE